MNYLDELGRIAFNEHKAFSMLPQAEQAAARLAFMAGWDAAMDEIAAALRHPDAAGVVLAGSDFRSVVPQ